MALAVGLGENRFVGACYILQVHYRTHWLDNVVLVSTAIPSYRGVCCWI